MVEDRYDLVSSLYGPGAVGCWYLTLLSCFVSWLAHPLKNSSGSIDPDFIATLTFPAVAAGHLIVQTHNFPNFGDAGTNQAQLIKLAASLEASLNVTENFLFISVALLLIAILRRCVRRAIMLSLVSLFCFLAEIDLSIKEPPLRKRHGPLFRLFLINYTWLLIVISALLVVLILFALGIVSMFYAKRPWRRHSADSVRANTDALINQRQGRILPRDRITEGRPLNDQALQSALDMEAVLELERSLQVDEFLESRHATLLTVVSIIFLPLSFIASLVPMSSHAVYNAPPSLWPWIQATASRLFRSMFPCTTYSTGELDQAVALLAGATVLCFSLYSAGLAQYRKRTRSVDGQRSESLLRQEQAMIRLQRLHSGLQG